MFKKNKQFTAVYQKRGKWYIGWIEEIPGANTQAKTIKELKENLKEALVLIIESNKVLTKKETEKPFIREPIYVSC
jgi:predicted RNase H-like HicB family nuclease